MFSTNNHENEVHTDMKIKSIRLVIFIFSAAACLLAAGILISYKVGLISLEAQHKMVEQLTVIDQILDVTSTLKDAETGQRGYLLTNQESYLEPFSVASANLQEKLNGLQLLALNHRVSEAKVKRLAGLVQEKMAELNLTIQLNKSKGLASALVVVKSGLGKNLMSQIRTVLRDMRLDEQLKFMEASRNAAWANTVRTDTFILIGLINFIFLTWSCRRIVHEIRRREKISEEINRQKELLATTLASIGDGVIITDEQGRVTFINMESERLTGWTNAEAVGHMLPEVFRIINESSREVVENPVEKVLRLGTIVGLANHTLLIRKDGTEVPIDDSAAPIRQPNGKLFGVVLVFRDFTQHKKTELSLKTLNQELSVLTEHLEKRVEERTHQLEEQAAQLRQLAVELTQVEESERKRLAQLLHDHLQQLLVAIKIRLELLTRKSNEIDKTALAEMGSFVDQAYDSSRSLTAELRPPVLYESGLGPALRFLARKFETEQKFKINLSIFSDAEPVSDLFKVMLYQSVQEALLNAVKYARTGECSLKMEKSADGKIHIIVQDEGVGFDTKTIGKKGTGGFGLFSIRERIRALGGECQINSILGKGTTLEMIVPSEIKISESEMPAIERIGTKVRKKGNVTVLIADDHKIVRQSLARALLSESFINEVFEASNGKEAIAIAEDKNPNFIIMDFNMPGMNGLEATRFLHQRNPNIKIIGLSVQAEQETIQTMKEAGAVEFFNKNEDIDVLVKTLKNLIEI